MLPLTTVVTHGGATVRCLDQGRGPRSVLALHGNPSVPWVWQPLIEALPATGHRGIAVDWYGDSDPPWGGYDVSGYADQAREVLDALNIDRTVLVGHSLGGVTALVFALRYPERLSGLILVGTGASSTGHGTIPSMLRRMAEADSAEQVLRQLTHTSYGTPPDAATTDAYVHHLLKKPLSVYMEAMRSTTRYDLVAQLRRIRRPTLVVHGRADTGRSIHHAQTMHHAIRGSELLVLESGHYVMEENRAEFNAAVIDFIRRHDL